jgi:hypothetical protein
LGVEAAGQQIAAYLAAAAEAGALNQIGLGATRGGLTAGTGLFRCTTIAIPWRRFTGSIVGVFTPALDIQDICDSEGEESEE